MITVTRKLWFSAGHRVYGHEGQCVNLHGHNYEAHITASSPELDPLGRVIDFSILKRTYDQWIQNKWDHGFLYWKEDRELCQAFLREELIATKRWVAPFNPTAENMAKHLLLLGPTLMLGTDVEIVKVKLFETPNCWAEVTSE